MKPSSSAENNYYKGEETSIIMEEAENYHSRNEFISGYNGTSSYGKVSKGYGGNNEA